MKIGKYKELINPITKKQAKKLQDQYGFFTVRLVIDFNDIVDMNGIEELNDYVEGAILENGVLEDISFKVVGHIEPKQDDSGDVIIEVCSKISDLDDDEDDDESVG